MCKKIKQFSAALLSCAAIVLLPSFAEARVQKPSASFRAPHLRTIGQNTWRPVFRQAVNYRSAGQDWTIRWWNKMDNHQQVDYILYGHFMN